MALKDNELAGILQGTRDFAKNMLEELGQFTPFGARCSAEGELEFFAFPPKDERNPIADLYKEVEAALIESARQREIVAGVIVANVIVPDDIDTPFRNAIGMHIEASGYSRFVYATFRLSTASAEGEKALVELGAMIPVASAPSIFES